jgi:hypothetical protein
MIVGRRAFNLFAKILEDNVAKTYWPELISSMGATHFWN